MALYAAKMSFSPATGSLRRHAFSSGIRSFHLLGINNNCHEPSLTSWRLLDLQNISVRALHHSPCRQFNTKNEDNGTEPSPSSSSAQEDNKEQAVLIYESPFAPLTLKLKRVSLTSAAIGIIGLPLLTVFYGSGDVPATGQLAVIATAAVTAVGSTVLLGYCFTPYVHTMELLHNTDDSATRTDVGDDNKTMIRMITRDILARQVTTRFDPSADVSPPPESNTRPFCNFMVHNKPYYIHPDLVTDGRVRSQLVDG